MNSNHFRTLAALVAIAFLALGAFLANQRYQPAPAKDQAVQQLWALQLKDAQNKTSALNQWQGKTIVLNFWATWCAPCVQEMPELQALQMEFQTKDVQLLGIGIDSASNIAEFAQKHQISYPLFAAGMEGTQLSEAMGNQHKGLPYTVLIDRQSHIVKRYSGRLDIAQLRSDIQAILKNKPD